MKDKTTRFAQYIDRQKALASQIQVEVDQGERADLGFELGANKGRNRTLEIAHRSIKRAREIVG